MTCSVFFQLCQQGKYDRKKFFRVVRVKISLSSKNCVIQAGDDSRLIRGYDYSYKNFEGEFADHNSLDTIGMLAVDNVFKDVTITRFFINLVPIQWLNEKYTVFGKIIKGIDVARAIGMVEVDEELQRPLNDVVILKARPHEI